jgi:hypothetical protein
VIEIQDLQKVIDGQTAVESTSNSVHPDEITAIVLISSGLIYGYIIWRVRQLDR